MPDPLKAQDSLKQKFSITPAASNNASKTGPQPVKDAASSSMIALLKLEADARAVETERELKFLIANETRKLVHARQVFVLRRQRPGKCQVDAVSSLDAVDRNSPLICWIERIITRLNDDAGLLDLREFALPAYCDAEDHETKNYPFGNFLWVPFKLRDGELFAGMLLAREQIWQESDMVIARRLSGCFAHAWAALTGTRRLKRTGTWKPYAFSAAALAAVVCLALPVPMTVLAPGQIVPRDPYVIAAPIEGIVDEIAIEPNTKVAPGDTLLRFVDTTLRNELELSESQVRLAQTKLQRQSLAAFEDAEAKRELRLAVSELQLKQAERDYAADLLLKTTLSAPRSGVAVFSSTKDWKGKPVSAGERIMEIADPQQVELEVRLPVDDAIDLAKNNRVKMFLDSDPLHAREATIIHVSHEATPDSTNVLSYRVIARLADADQSIPRLGEHGTAQLFGHDVALFYYLFRRPITALRQHTGL